MNRKTLSLVLCCVVAATQVAATGWTVIRHEMILQRGELYRFKTAPVDPVCAFRGRYVALAFDESDANLAEDLHVDGGEQLWVTVAVGSDGFARLTSATIEQPDGVTAIRCRSRFRQNAGNVRVQLPFSRYYMNEELAPEAEAAYRAANQDGAKEAYVSVRVLNGHAVIEELFIEDVPIREYLGSR